MLPGLQLGQRFSRAAVETLEEAVDRRRSIDVPRARGPLGIERIRRRRIAVPQLPEQAGRVQLEKLMIVHRRETNEKSLADQQLEQVVPEARIVGRAQAEPAAQELADRAARIEADPLRRPRRVTQADETAVGAELIAVRIEPPHLVELLLRAPADLLLRGLLKAIAGDGQLPAEMIQQRADERLPLPRREHCRGRMKPPEHVRGAQRI